MNRKVWKLLPIVVPLALIALVLTLTTCSPREKPEPTAVAPVVAARADAVPAAPSARESDALPAAESTTPVPGTPAAPTASAPSAPAEPPATTAADSAPVAASPASSDSDMESLPIPVVAAIDASEPAVPEPASSAVREEPGTAVSDEPLQPATDATASAPELQPGAAEESADARTEEPVVELLVSADEADRTPASEAPAPAIPSAPAAVVPAILDSAASASPQTAPIRVGEAPPPVEAEPADEDAGPLPLSVATEVPPAAVPEDAGEPPMSPVEDVRATLPDADELGAEIPPLVLPDETMAQLEAAGEALGDLFSQSAEAFAGLESYRYSTVFSFTGEKSGESESGSIEVHGAVASADRQTLAWKDLESGEEFAIVRVGARAWIREGDEWAEVPEFVADAMSQGLLIYSPVMGWSLFAEELETTSTFVGEEVVNGIPTKHYTSSYAGWPSHEESEVTHAEGNVWIAEAGYPVRYRFAAKVTDSDGESGSVLWTMELSDVNAPITIEAP